MIHSHCLIWANRLSDSCLINHKLSFKVRLFFAITLYPSTSPTPLPVRPSLAHFLWPLNTSLRLLEHFLKDHDDFHTSPLPLIYYAETGSETGKRAAGQQKHWWAKNHSQKKGGCVPVCGTQGSVNGQIMEEAINTRLFVPTKNFCNKSFLCDKNLIIPKILNLLVL